MIMRYFNIIFLSITKLYSLVKPIKRPLQDRFLGIFFSDLKIFEILVYKITRKISDLMIPKLVQLKIL